MLIYVINLIDKCKLKCTHTRTQMSMYVCMPVYIGSEKRKKYALVAWGTYISVLKQTDMITRDDVCGQVGVNTVKQESSHQRIG